MPDAVLRVRTEGGADALALLEGLDRALGRSRSRRSAATARAASDDARSYRAAGDEAQRQDQLVTRSRLRHLALQGEQQKRAVALYTEMHRRATEVLSAEIGRRGDLTDRERRQVEGLALAMVHQHETAERRRTAATVRAERERAAQRRRFLAGAAEGIAGGVRRGAEIFAEYGDDVRAKQHTRDAGELSATRIAASDIGDAGASSQLLAATQRTALDTGLDPQGVVDALGTAQANFSALADAAERGTYLNEVLPMLARAAVASGTSLTDMVNAAGEFQRQLGVSTAQLPVALAQAIQGGRLGSISFGDQARHMGVIGGAAARFLSSRPEDALQSLSTTNALFQFAGRAGGGGDVSATRARAFLDNFTSARGQKALNSRLGYNVMGADGQIITRDGETQSQAFQRVIQDVYARSRGNSTRFLDTVAGQNNRSRTLGDQLFRDLRKHGGHLGDFSALVSQQAQGTVANSIDAPFRAVHATAANARSRREVRELYGLTSSANDWARDTEDQLAGLREAHPLVGRVVGADPVSRAALDLTNMAANAGSASVRAPDAGRPTTRAALQLAIAREQASASMQREFSPVGLASMDDGVRASMMRYRTAEGLARLQLRDQARAEGQSTTQISEESIRRLADEIARSLQRNPVTISEHDAVHAATVRTTR